MLKRDVSLTGSKKGRSKEVYLLPSFVKQLYFALPILELELLILCIFNITMITNSDTNEKRKWK